MWQVRKSLLHYLLSTSLVKRACRVCRWDLMCFSRGTCCRSDSLCFPTCSRIQRMSCHMHRYHLIIVIMNLIYIAQFDTNGIPTALYIVITTYKCSICTYEHTWNNYIHTHMYISAHKHIHRHMYTCINLQTYWQDCPYSYYKLAHTLTPTCILRHICPCIIYIHTHACVHRHIPYIYR